MDKIWVELAASGSTAHGPTLRIRLVSHHHPAVQAASRAVQAASEADYAPLVLIRAQRAARVPSGQPAAETSGHQQASWLSASAVLRSCYRCDVPGWGYHVGDGIADSKYAEPKACMHTGW